jgi:predicted RNA-binding Zn ribbon-like protein
MATELDPHAPARGHDRDHSHPFDLDGGHLALDFANTLEGRFDETPRELLRTYADLVHFAEASGLLAMEAAERLHAAAAQRPDHAAQALAAARTLREALFGVFSALAAEQAPPPDALATLNAALKAALPHGQVTHDQVAGIWVWAWEETGDLSAPLWPVAHAAAELLIHGPLDRLRECAADDCGWLFIDTTRNRARRWCSMQTCGNRAKVQQFRARAAQGKTGHA